MYLPHAGMTLQCFILGQGRLSTEWHIKMLSTFCISISRSDIVSVLHSTAMQCRQSSAIGNTGREEDISLNETGRPVPASMAYVWIYRSNDITTTWTEVLNDWMSRTLANASQPQGGCVIQNCRIYDSKSPYLSGYSVSS